MHSQTCDDGAESTFEKEVTNEDSNQGHARHCDPPFEPSLIDLLIVLRAAPPAGTPRASHNRHLSRDMDYVFV
jgi:hypothetical protein